MIGDLPGYLTPGDLLVVNDTRVFPARLLGHRVPSGGAVEVLLLGPPHASHAPAGDSPEWSALVHPGQKLIIPGKSLTPKTAEAAPKAESACRKNQDLSPCLTTALPVPLASATVLGQTSVSTNSPRRG